MCPISAALSPEAPDKLKPLLGKYLPTKHTSVFMDGVYKLFDFRVVPETKGDVLIGQCFE